LLRGLGEERGSVQEAALERLAEVVEDPLPPAATAAVLDAICEVITPV